MCCVSLHRANLTQVKGLTSHKARDRKTSELWTLVSEILVTTVVNLLLSDMIARSTSSKPPKVNHGFSYNGLYFFVFIFRLLVFLSMLSSSDLTVLHAILVR